MRNSFAIILVISVLVVLCLSSSCLAQITAPVADQIKPVEGGGHDYIHLLNETINPQTGSVSVRIGVPGPDGRELAAPFSFSYDSNSAHHGAGWQDNSGYLGTGGWSMLIPSLNFSWGAVVGPVDPGQGNGGIQIGCNFYTGYMFEDAGGTTHALKITNLDTPSTSNNQDCAYVKYWMQEYLSGGDASVTAFTTPLLHNNDEPQPVTVSDSNGDVYYFSNAHLHNFPGDNTDLPGSGNSWTELPDSVKDRNGNTVTYSDSGTGSITITDTLGRAAIAVNGFGSNGNGAGSQVTVSGLGTYTITWAQQNFDMLYNVQELPPPEPSSPPYISCMGPADAYTGYSGFDSPGTIPVLASSTQAPPGSRPQLPLDVITKITLPNGQFYAFQYDPAYGLLTKVTYPDGAYSRYVWTTNPLASGDISNARDGSNANAASPCEMIYDEPAVAQKFTSFDGVHEVLEQDYTYTPTTWSATSQSPFQKWTAKQTTVVTKDLVAGTSFKTVYNYSPIPVDPTGITDTLQQRQAGVTPVNPTEASILSYDSSGNLLKTVTKSYADFWAQPNDEKTTLENGQTTEERKCYMGSQAYLIAPWCSQSTGNAMGGGSILTDIWTYDYGASTGSASNPGAPGSLLLHKHADYNLFQTPLYSQGATIYRTKDIISYDGSNNRVAESDFCFDGDTSAFSGCASSSLQPASAIQHDETNFPASYVHGRGNVTTAIARCFVGTTACSQGDAIARYTWDETGQMLSKTDANGNTTHYSFADSFDTGVGIFGATNSYLTGITDALNHTVSYQYAFGDGQLIQATGENGDQSNFYYEQNGLRRLIKAIYADGGQSLKTYNEASYPPNIVTQKSLDSSRLVTSTAILDGGTHVTQAQLNSDPQGMTQTTSTFDGLGRAYLATNAFRSTSDPTYASSSTQFDALGRVVTLTRQDNSTVTTSYSGLTTTVTNEAGNQRRSVTNALGQLVEVDEPGDNYPATPAIAAPTPQVTGTLRSVSGVGAVSATQSTGWITIGGSEQSKTVGGQNQTLWDNGTVSVTINGQSAGSTTYGQGTLASNIASALVTSINNSPVGSQIVASPAGNTINLKFKAGGAFTWSVSASVTSLQNFSPPSFSTSTSGSITGGTNGNPGTTVYDYGNVTVTVGSWTSAGAPYGQSGANAGNNTAPLVAQALLSVLNVSGSPVTAQVVNGNGLVITCKTMGTACNGESVTISSTTSYTQYFSGGSFSGAATMMGGGGNAEASSLAIPFVTLYKYDSLGNLLCVEQHGDATNGTGCSSYPNPTAGDSWRPRMFTYDSLGHLLTAYNPESGWITYTYDADGNVLTKTDARGIKITYSYDALNRVTGETFSNGDPAITYTYDQGTNGLGHRTGMTDASGSTSWTYDIMGRVASETRTINPGPGLNPVTRTLSYQYDLAGNPTQITYPDGTVVQYAEDNAGRDLSAIDTTHGINYVANATYAPVGGIASFTEGAGSTTITNSFLYNPRLQVCREIASTVGITPQSCTDATHIGNLMDFQYDFHVGNADNGNLYTAANNKDTSRTQTYAYDTLNRLLKAQTQGTLNSSGQIDCTIMVAGSTTQTKYWGESFAYDAWGNLTGKISTLCNAENATLTVNAQNQLLSAGYNAAGDMTSNGGATYAYNGDGEMVSAGGYTYLYDGDGNRVAKTNGSTGTLYWYGAPGIVLETDLLGNPQSEYIFFGGSRIARRDVSGVSSPVYYYFANQIHSTALITDANGNIEDDADYYPWGGTLQFNSNLANHYWFSGKERDAESGFDYFGARYYGNTFGRFTQPDWSAKAVGIPYADLTNPHCLNLYGYVCDNPIIKVDPDGHSFWSEVKEDVSAAIGYVKKVGYAKVEGGIGVDAGVKIGPVKATVGAKDVMEHKFTSEVRTKKEVTEIGAKVHVGPVTVGLAHTQEKLLAKNDTVIPHPETESHATLGFDAGKEESSTAGKESGGEFGIGVDLGVVLHLGLEVGVDGKQVLSDIKSKWGTPNPPAPPPPPPPPAQNNNSPNSH